MMSITACSISLSLDMVTLPEEGFGFTKSDGNTPFLTNFESVCLPHIPAGSKHINASTGLGIRVGRLVFPGDFRGESI